jgi:hypothetical protein
MVVPTAFAYTRDPLHLFSVADDSLFAPPLNFENIIYNGIQPVRYERQKLKISLGGFLQKNNTVEVVDIDWLNGTLRCFYNKEEALNGITAFTLEQFRIHCSPENIYDYIIETISFLKRGHSLTHPQCTCQHEIKNSRCKTLGISHIYSDYNKRRHEIPCYLPRHPREFSAEEISKELAITDVILFKIGVVELLPILNHHCRIRVHGSMLYFSFQDFIFSPLDNREDLLNIISSQPLTFTIERDSYSGIYNDVMELKQLQRIYILGSIDNDTKLTIFYFNPRWDFNIVDKDIIDMWHSVNMKEISSSQSIPVIEKKYHSKDKKILKRTTTMMKKKKNIFKLTLKKQ